MKIKLFSALFLFLFSFHASALSVPVIVKSQWLKQHLGEKNLSIIEFSDSVDFTFNGHIPGSVGTNKSDWRFEDKDGSLVHYPVDVLVKKLRQLGINQGDAVVIYYKGNNTDEVLGAVYLFWLFHYLGHTNVGVLDEGWFGWKRSGGQTESREVNIKPGNFTARPLKALEIETLELNKIRKNYLLVDGRPSTHFQGLTKFDANPRYGRIPGAVSQPWQDYMRKDEKTGLVYAKAPKIPALLAAKRIDPDTPILLTCLGGTGSAFNYLMFYQAGYHNLRVHDAAMRRWNNLRLPLIKTNVHGKK